MSEEDKDEIIQKQAEVIARLTKERDEGKPIPIPKLEPARPIPRPVEVLEPPVQTLRFNAYPENEPPTDKDRYIRELEQEVKNLKAYIKRRERANQ